MKRRISLLVFLTAVQLGNAQVDSSKWSLSAYFCSPVLTQKYAYTEYKEELGAKLNVFGSSISAYYQLTNKSSWSYRIGMGMENFNYKFRNVPYGESTGGEVYSADLIGSQFVLTLNNRFSLNMKAFLHRRNYVCLDLALGLLQYDRRIFDNGGSYSYESYGYSLNYLSTELKLASPLYLKTSMDYGIDLFPKWERKQLQLMIGIGTSVSDGIDFYKFYLDSRVGLTYFW